LVAALQKGWFTVAALSRRVSSLNTTVRDHRYNDHDLSFRAKPTNL